MADNSELVNRWFDEVWNKKNKSFIREMTTDQTVHHGLNGPGGPDTVGIEAFEQYYDFFTAAYPDLKIEMLEVLPSGDKVAARFRVTGTHKAPVPDFLTFAQRGGQLDVLAPTNKKINIEGGGVCRFENGKFAEVWNQVDFLKMYYDLSDSTPDVE